jgi:hypothetical protein
MRHAAGVLAESPSADGADSHTVCLFQIGTFASLLTLSWQGPCRQPKSRVFDSFLGLFLFV